MKKMRITVLGSGTSTGVPMIRCQCSVCVSTDSKNKRLRASIFIEVEEKSLLVDVSPDFRLQALSNSIQKIDAILLTHPHFDHIGGIDEIRSYNFYQKASIPAYGHDWTLRDLRSRVPYIFSSKTSSEGGGVARIELHEFSLDQDDFLAAGVRIIPIRLQHGSQEVAGFRVGNFAYLTDCNFISDAAIEKLKGIEVLILDCLRIAQHDTHLDFDTALDYSMKIAAKQTYLTHLSHDFDFARDSRNLPKNIGLAYDGLIINL